MIVVRHAAGAIVATASAGVVELSIDRWSYGTHTVGPSAGLTQSPWWSLCESAALALTSLMMNGFESEPVKWHKVTLLGLFGSGSSMAAQPIGSGGIANTVPPAIATNATARHAPLKSFVCI
jgi:hypothetical protein